MFHICCGENIFVPEKTATKARLFFCCFGEVIIHEDFAENFQLKHQNEIMAAQWSNESVTIFTAFA